MIEKTGNKYESPLIKVLLMEVKDMITTSGNNFYEWDWDSEESYDSELFG